MHIILFEDLSVPQLFPATAARAAFMMTVGTYRLVDLVRRFDAEIELVVRPYLNSLVAADSPWAWNPSKGERSGPVVLINARTVPHVAIIEQINNLLESGRSGVVRHNHQIVCSIFQNPQVFPNNHIGISQLLGIVEDSQLESFDAKMPLFEYAHDLVRHQVRIMNDNLNDRIKNGQYKEIADGVFADGEISLGPYFVSDTKAGPIVIESGATIGPYCFMKGPVYVGPKVKIIEHAAIKDAVTLGSTAKIGGEVEASIIEAYSNKQHHGFLGHSYLGSWINLGAGTCNSDLKNSYGEVVMEYENRKVKTGMQFVGCIIGDYSKSAINTSIFTGKTIGACSMVYGFVTTNVPSFVNYARSFGQVTETAVDVMISTQARMFSRRNVEQRPCDAQLIRDIYELTKHERHLANEPLSL